jgi:hypothetical protein
MTLNQFFWNKLQWCEVWELALLSVCGAVAIAIIFYSIERLLKTIKNLYYG